MVVREESSTAKKMNVNVLSNIYLVALISQDFIVGLLKGPNCRTCGFKKIVDADRTDSKIIVQM